jgi:hypothetical protein
MRSSTDFEGSTRLPGTPSGQSDRTVSAAEAEVAKARRRSVRKRIGVRLGQHTPVIVPNKEAAEGPLLKTDMARRLRRWP